MCCMCTYTVLSMLLHMYNRSMLQAICFYKLLTFLCCLRGYFLVLNLEALNKNIEQGSFLNNGGVAQMVERSLSMREVPGSIPGASTESFYFVHDFFDRHYL